VTSRQAPNATSIDIDTNVPLVRITREFNAPPEKVFLAHVDPDLFARWNGPNDTTMTVGHHDCRTGFEDRDAFVASGMESGVVQGYERLDAILTTLGNP
jgi:uncharacterized protein YndB with AHSA1/START domain